MTETISKRELKANMWEVFCRIEAGGDELIVTDHGKPVLRIVPIREKYSVSQLLAGLQGQVVYHQDIDSPMVDERGEG
jgi:prevent-host-death family protein